MKSKKTIAITANSYHYLLKFRSELARYLHQAGFEVIFVSPLDESALARDSGIEHCPLSFDKGGYSFIALAVSFVQMVRIIRTRKVDIVINNTIKPLLTFSFVKYVPFLNVKVCSIVTGLGYLFTHDTLKARLVRQFIRPVYRLSSSANSILFLHNPDDELLLKQHRYIKKNHATCITYGSGVDVQRFSYRPVVNYRTFVFVGRLLRDKGVVEFLSAAAKIKQRYQDARFIVVGDYDNNPAALPRGFLDYYIRDGVIEYSGYVEDVRDCLTQASCMVLPSYREGCPRSVIEALAIGRAIITTDVPGCRETVISGRNGYLVKKESVAELVEAMERIILDPESVDRFSGNSRRYAESKFNIESVNGMILARLLASS